MGIPSPFWREHAHEAADTLDAPESALRACSQSPMQGGPKAPLPPAGGSHDCCAPFVEWGTGRDFGAEAPPVEDEGLTAAA
eukprot:1207721-Prymnesium_polylepis.1